MVFNIKILFVAVVVNINNIKVTSGNTKRRSFDLLLYFRKFNLDSFVVGVDYLVDYRVEYTERFDLIQHFF